MKRHPTGLQSRARRQLFMSAATAAIAVAAARATGEAHPDNRGIVGSWFGVITATNPPAGQGNNLFSFSGDGTLVESRRYFVSPTPFGNLLETTGHGAWRRTGRHTFEAVNRILIQNADTSVPIGVDEVRLSLRLSDDDRTLSGTWVARIMDSSIVVLFELAGDYSAERISV
jgi:hypothetical protein